MLAGKRQNIEIHSNMIKVEIKGPSDSKLIDYVIKELGDLVKLSPEELMKYWDNAEIAEIERLNKIVFAYLVGNIKRARNTTD